MHTADLSDGITCDSISIGLQDYLLVVANQMPRRMSKRITAVCRTGHSHSWKKPDQAIGADGQSSFGCDDEDNHLGSALSVCYSTCELSANSELLEISSIPQDL